MIGSTLGEYQIVRLIGQGGMGAVYEALQQKIGRRVALKVLLPEFATNPELIERFFNGTTVKNLRREIANLQAQGKAWEKLFLPSRCDVHRPSRRQCFSPLA
jgi:serine/threonine protein kinase